MTNSTIHLETVTVRLPELEQAWTRKTDAAESYADAVANVAKQAGIEPGALKAYINEKMRDKLAQLDKQSEQLSLMLETFE